MSSPGRVVVIGGGVAGLFCAYYLAKRNVEVVVVEGEHVGSPEASSYGNGGWISPAQAGPLPEPGLTVYGLRALADRDSALYFKRSYLPRVLPWLWHFRRYCNERSHERGTAALIGLGSEVFELVEAMEAEGIEFELYRLGMICAAGDEESAGKVLESLQPMREFGYDIPESLLIGDDLHELEPALSQRVRAGFHIKESWHVEPRSYTAGVAGALRKAGVEIHEQTKITGFDVADRSVRAAKTANGEIEGDAFVLAAGSWTRPLAAKLGVDFPMEPGKGYTFFIRPKLVPKHGILFADIHAGATPLGERVRIGGTMEFSGYNTDVDDRRIETVFTLAREYVSELESQQIEEPWAGMRPMLADGLPVIDRAVPWGNAFIATGYSMLGITLAPPAGKALAELITTGTRPKVLDPFRVDRFGRSPLDRAYGAVRKSG